MLYLIFHILLIVFFFFFTWLGNHIRRPGYLREKKVKENESKLPIFSSLSLHTFIAFKKLIADDIYGISLTFFLPQADRTERERKKRWKKEGKIWHFYDFLVIIFVSLVTVFISCLQWQYFLQRVAEWVSHKSLENQLKRWKIITANHVELKIKEQLFEFWIIQELYFIFLFLSKIDNKTSIKYIFLFSCFFLIRNLWFKFEIFQNVAVHFCLEGKVFSTITNFI